MGFPDNILTKDEKVVRSLHPHWLTVVVPAVIGLLIVAATWVIVVLTPVDPTWDVVDWVIIAIAIVLFLAFVLVPFLKWRTTHYVITSNRVVVRRGILAKAGQDIALSKITDVSFRQSFFDRIIRSGSLQIETAGDSADEEFKNIPSSNQVQQLLNHLIEEDAARRGGYGMAARTGYEQMGGRHAEYHQAPPAPAGAGDTRELPSEPASGGAPEATREPTAPRASNETTDARADRGSESAPEADAGSWETPPQR